MTDSPATAFDPEAILADGSPAYFRSLAAYAAARTNPDNGKPFTRAAASKWKEAGLISFVSDPTREGKQLVDALASDRARADHQNPLKRQAPAPGADQTAVATVPVPDAAAESSAALSDQPQPSGAADDTLSEPPQPSVRDQVQQTVSAAKARGAVLDAKMKELAYKEKLAQLASVADLRLRETNRMGALRDALVQLAGLVAEEANPDDPARARKAIAAGMNTVLNKYLAEARSDLETAAHEARIAAEERAAERAAAHA
ncbi:hypothetical protein ABWI01_03450 [Oceanicaulis alexandrii]|uniref:hypothetical protein n=1 Tax=Oceanicaulis alexandrii TaxID=153233 RepID=UPI0035CFD63E